MVRRYRLSYKIAEPLRTAIIGNLVGDERLCDIVREGLKKFAAIVRRVLPPPAGKMRQSTVIVDKELLDTIDRLVDDEYFMDRNEFLRTALFCAFLEKNPAGPLPTGPGWGTEEIAPAPANKNKITAPNQALVRGLTTEQWADKFKQQRGLK